MHSFYLGIIGYPPFSVLRHNPSASEDCFKDFKVSRDQTWEAQHCLRATVLAKSTRICSCSMVATVWTASTKMPTSLSCFGKRQAAVVPLRYMFHAFFFTFVQPQLSLHLNFPMDRDLFLWHQTFLTRKLPSSIFSTINDPTKIKISTLSRRFRFSGTKWRISTTKAGVPGPGGVFGGHVMWRRRNLHLESQLPSPDQPIKVRVSSAPITQLSSATCRKKSSRSGITHFTWRNFKHQSVCTKLISNTTLQNHPSVLKCCFLDNITGACRKCWEPGRFLMLLGWECLSSWCNELQLLHYHHYRPRSWTLYQWAGWTTPHLWRKFPSPICHVPFESVPSCKERQKRWRQRWEHPCLAAKWWWKHVNNFVNWLLVVTTSTHSITKLQFNVATCNHPSFHDLLYILHQIPSSHRTSPLNVFLLRASTGRC